MASMPSNRSQWQIWGWLVYILNFSLLALWMADKQTFEVLEKCQRQRTDCEQWNQLQRAPLIAVTMECQVSRPIVVAFCSAKHGTNTRHYLSVFSLSYGVISFISRWQLFSLTAVTDLFNVIFLFIFAGMLYLYNIPRDVIEIQHPSNFYNIPMVDKVTNITIS